MSHEQGIPASTGVVPLTRRGIERRAALLQAANTLFLERGFNAVSLDDIVQVCGGSKAAIYQYFGSKKGLLGALFEYRCENFLKKIRRLHGNPVSHYMTLCCLLHKRCMWLLPMQKILHLPV